MKYSVHWPLVGECYYHRFTGEKSENIIRKLLTSVFLNVISHNKSSNVTCTRHCTAIRLASRLSGCFTDFLYRTICWGIRTLKWTWTLCSDIESTGKEKKLRTFVEFAALLGDKIRCKNNLTTPVIHYSLNFTYHLLYGVFLFTDVFLIIFWRDTHHHLLQNNCVCVVDAE